jgi:hypothetical protein
LFSCSAPQFTSRFTTDNPFAADWAVARYSRMTNTDVVMMEVDQVTPCCWLLVQPSTNSSSGPLTITNTALAQQLVALHLRHWGWNDFWLLFLLLLVQGIPPALRLAPTQLAEVLRRLTLAERLHHCSLVCKAFQHAAVLATGQVTIKAWPDSYAAACSWLQAHGLAAAVSSISVKPLVLTMVDIDQQLPWDQLPMLQQLTPFALQNPSTAYPRAVVSDALAPGGLPGGSRRLGSVHAAAAPGAGALLARRAQQ